MPFISIFQIVIKTLALLYFYCAILNLADILNTRNELSYISMHTKSKSPWQNTFFGNHSNVNLDFPLN